MKKVLVVSLLLFSCRQQTEPKVVYVKQNCDSLKEANIYLENELNRCYDENQILGSALAEYEINK
jgi:hypothetical protein